MKKRKQRILTKEDISKISTVYHNWRNAEGIYENINGFCQATTLEDVKINNFILSPNTYVKPALQKIDLKIDFNSTDIPNRIKALQNKINQKTDNILMDWNEEHHFKVNEIFALTKLSKDYESILHLLLKGIIKKYFLEYHFNKSTKLSGKAPKGWSARTFDELFQESSIKVEDLDFLPQIYSVTNAGIQPREEKYTKELSKNVTKYKVAYMGDMVFGLSREIPNLDVFTEEIGSFSGAYHIFRPKDFRIGIIVGTIMRLKLNEQTDLLKGGAREGRSLNKEKLKKKIFTIPSTDELDLIWNI